MVDEWRSSNWGDEVTLEYGKAIRGYSPFQGKYRVFGANGPIGWTSQALAQGPGVILGRKGAYRGVEYWREPFWVIDTAYYLVPKTEMDMRWLYYAVKHYKLGDIDDGSPIPSTTRAAVYMLEINVPPQSEQRAIAQILGTIDDKIELNRRRNQTLEAMARALFQDWFVDFGPVRAKMEGREPYLPADLWQLFPEHLNAEGAPEGWYEARAETVADIGIGKTPPRKEHQWFSTADSDVRWVSIRDMGNSGLYLQSTSEYLTSAAVEKFNVRTVPDNTVILSFKLTVGRVAITDGEMVTNEAIAHLKVGDQKRLSTEYLYSYLREFDYGSLGSTSSIATAVNSKSIKALPILVPTNDLAGHFAQRVGPIFARIKYQQSEAATLAQLRDTLLPKLISGELRIADADRITAKSA